MTNAQYNVSVYRSLLLKATMIYNKILDEADRVDISDLVKPDELDAVLEYEKKASIGELYTDVYVYLCYLSKLAMQKEYGIEIAKILEGRE